MKPKRWRISEKRIISPLLLQISKPLKFESRSFENSPLIYKQLWHPRGGLHFFTMVLFFLWLKAGLSHLLFHLALLNPLLAILPQSWKRKGVITLIHCRMYWQELRHSTYWRPWIFIIVIHCGTCFLLALSLHFLGNIHFFLLLRVNTGTLNY